MGQLHGRYKKPHIVRKRQLLLGKERLVADAANSFGPAVGPASYTAWPGYSYCLFLF